MATVTKHTANPPPDSTDEKLRYLSRRNQAMTHSPQPTIRPKTVRPVSFSQLLSMAYFTKNPMPITRARIPILPNRFSPTIFSKLRRLGLRLGFGSGSMEGTGCGWLEDSSFRCSGTGGGVTADMASCAHTSSGSTSSGCMDCRGHGRGSHSGRCSASGTMSGPVERDNSSRALRRLLILSPVFLSLSIAEAIEKSFHNVTIGTINTTKTRMQTSPSINP